ncbi:hypothetical protein [Streptomyces sp. NBC_01012]|uniref:hypothetical protein n=1 Tax=Streptomyces sp. NBC_01012 TaxID=2903717 RepID=UPI0038688B94|nr:hypothetical protein OG623_06365 [Streptomyces sp. NBC_01012]
MSEEWAWLEERPVFTTHGEKGGSVTRVPPGAALARLTSGFVLLVAGFAVSLGLTIAGFGLVFASRAETGGGTGWWWLVLGVPAAVVALITFSGTFTTGTELIMRGNARNLVMFAGVLCGVAIGLGGLALRWSWRASDIRLHPEAFDYPGWNDHQRFNSELLAVGAVLAAVAGLVLAVLAVRSVRRARRDVERILHLRQTAPRSPGVVAKLPDPRSWNGGGDVPIRYDDEHGRHEIRVRVNTTAGKIPVPGTHVIVFTGPDGDLLVEIDPEHALEYHPDNRPYESSSSMGGN